MKGKIKLLFIAFVLLATILPSSIPASASDESIAYNPSKLELPRKGNPKLDSRLGQLVYAKQAGNADIFARENNIILDDERVRVIVECSSDQAAAIQTANSLGTVEASYDDLLQISLPVTNLAAMAESSGTKFIRMPFEPAPAVISEGVELINADDWLAAGYAGGGIKVGILDLGFIGYSALLGSELPASVTGMSFSASTGYNLEAGSPHGTACAEVIFDICPYAEFYFANFSSDVEMGNAVNWMIAQGVDVISCSIAWPGGGPGNGTGSICSMVDSARAAGILWSQSAGNYATQHWQGTFNDTNSNNYHDFDPGIDESNAISVNSGSTIISTLVWDDTWGASANDYDLLLVDSSMQVVASGATSQDGNDNPREALQYTATYTGVYHLFIYKYSATRNVNFHMFSFLHPLQYQVTSSSLSVPADSPSAMTVGAVYWNNPTSLESFSSQGPTTDSRIKPDLVAPDGVTGVTYNPFYGTSAAAPCGAGAAVLVKQAYPAYTPAQVQAYLEGNAVDLGDGGKDNLFGSGRLDMGSAPAQSTGSISGYVYETDGITPVTGATVSAYGPTKIVPAIQLWSPDGQDTTDGSGYYSITGLDLADYQVAAVATGYERELFDEVHVMGAGTPVTVTSGDDTSAVNFTLGPGGTISGTVRNAEGTVALANVSVIASYPSTTPQMASSALTDAGGEYTLDGLSYGDYSVSSPFALGLGPADDNYIVENWQEKMIFIGGADMVTVDAGANPTGIDFTLETGARITGHLFQEGAGTPINGAKVFVYEFASLSGSWVLRGIGSTNADGYYESFTVTSGTYGVRSQAAGYVSEWYDNAPNQTLAEPVTVTTPTNTTNIDFTLNQAGYISGTVYEADGTTPIPNLHIYACDYATNAWVAGINTDQDGNYTLTLPAGTYRVSTNSSVSGLSYLNEYYDDTYDYNQADQIGVSVGQTVSGIDFSLEPGAMITGTVYQSDGVTPISNLHVNASEYGTGKWVAGTSTNQSGNYTLVVPSGTYTVMAHSQYPFAGEYYNNTYNINDATQITVTVPQIAGPVDFVLNAGGFISGRVYGADGITPIPNLHVNASDYTTNTWLDGVNTDADGYYSLVVPPGTYRVRACPSAGSGFPYMDEFYDDTYDYNQAFPVAVFLGGITSGIDFALEAGGSISGYVYQYDGITPIPDAQVNVAGIATGEWYAVTSTDVNGFFQVSGLATGMYRVGARAPGFVEEYYDNVYGWHNGSQVEVTAPGTTSNINFSLQAAGMISGTVYESDGVTPIANLHVNASDYTTNDWIAGTNTDQSGNYVLFVPAGIYRVYACASCSGLPYLNEYFDDTWDYNQADQVEATVGETTLGIDFALELGGTISGYVYDPVGNPVAGANVQVFDYATLISDKWNSFASTQTDENGYYITCGLLTGSYGIQVNVGGYATMYYNNVSNRFDASIINVTSGENTPGIDFNLALGGTISGYITDSVTGLPVANISVDAERIDVPIPPSWGATSDQDGYYTITGLPLGTYKVRSPVGWGSGDNGYLMEYYNNKPDHASADIITVSPDAIDIDFALNMGGSISGHVQNLTGAPITGAQIDIIDYASLTGKWIFITGTQTDTNGDYTVQGLLGGTYAVRVTAFPYIMEIYNDTRDPSQAQEVVVTAPGSVGNIDFILDIGGTISGYVFESDGSTPIPNLHVHANDSVTGWWIAGIGTDANGHYVLGGLPEGDYFVRACATCSGLNFVDEWYDDVYNQNQAQSIHVTVPVDTPDIDFSLGQAGSISGHVEDSTGAPIAGANIEVIEYSSLSGKYNNVAWAQTDAGGNYSTTGLPSGTYAVRVQVVPYILEWYDDTQDPNLAEPVVVIAPAVVSGIDFVLELGGTISGYVYQSDGVTPIPNLHVFATDNITGMWMAGASTDINGHYVLGGLPEGGYFVRACATCNGLSYVDEWYDNAYYQNQAIPVPVTVPDDTSNINFSLVTPLELPDLVISEKHEEWMEEGISFVIHFTVQNIGTGTAPAGHDVMVNSLGIGTETIEVPVSLVSGQSWSGVSSAQTYTGSPIPVIVTADQNGEVVESNESNNSRFNTFSYPPKPDLVITGYETWVETGVSYFLQYTVTNQGNATAPAGHDFALIIDGVHVETYEVPVALAPGSSYSGSSATVYLSGGWDSVVGTADINNEIDESVETNNSRYGTLAWPPAPDLEVTNANITWVDADTYIINFGVVRNIGNSEAAAGHDLALYVDGVLFNTVPISVTMYPGNVQLGFFNIQIDLTGGNDEVMLVTDVYNDIAESREDNNIFSTTVLVTPTTTVEVNSGETISMISGGSWSDIPLTIKGIPDPGLGGFTFELTWNKDVIHVESVTAGTISGFFILPGDPDNDTGSVIITGFSLGDEYPVGDVTVATLNISALGNAGDTTSIDVIIDTLSDENIIDIPAAPVGAPVQIINLVAETGISLVKDDDGIIVVSIDVTRIKDPATGETVDIPGGIGSFIASATVTPESGMQFLDVRPFGVIPDPVTGIFSGVLSPSLDPPGTLAKLVSILSGNCTTPYILNIAVQDIVAAGDPGIHVMEEHSSSITFLRGDASNNGKVDILDAMYIAQYIVKKKTLEQINGLNAASVKHDTGGDKIDILDAMYIAQYIVKKRDAYFNLK